MSSSSHSAEDHRALRDEVRAWLAEHWDAAAGAGPDWMSEVIDAGWAVPTWPTDWHGRGLTAEGAAVVGEEFARVGAPGARVDQFHLFANTLVTFGTDEAKREFLRDMLDGKISVCLLYSEPGAGSDLASVQTRADRDGDEWVVNGQKVWTSGGATADYGMLLVRTDWDVPKHQGLSFMWLPMKQPGVEVRPIRQITNESHFNEVFITDARVPAANLLGPLHGGWRVLQTALAYERSVMGEIARTTRSEGMNRSGAFELAELARAAGRNDDPVLRQRMAYIYSLQAVNRWNSLRAKAQLELGTPSPIMSLGKLAMSRILHQGAAVQQAILGAEALLVGDDHPDGATASFLALNAYFTSIGGGTDQIQRNIIGERVLGLPREPETMKDTPFKDVPKATVTRPDR